MKATGIVRRIDDLGRVVIPKEIRRTMHIREGEPLEIYTDTGGNVIFRKYSPVGELNTFAQQLCDALSKTCTRQYAVLDRDGVIAASAGIRRELEGKAISAAVEKLLETRAVQKCADTELCPALPSLTCDVVVPVIASGDLCGGIVRMSDDEEADAASLKLMQFAAAFLAKQMED
ncbi:MAG: AbrB/MazE/SpoVT family DNA-binding domain-containing protein [Clostridia bacterium]|nr:AbrB/MazE/SpoVT family DNA-binding domain-containing protein [Clostridia bacterium]